MISEEKKECWWQKKIRELECEVKRLSEKEFPIADVNEAALNATYAQAYYDCLSKYGILSKLQRRRIKERIEALGPSGVNKRREGMVIA